MSKHIQPLSYTKRFSDLAAANPERPAVIFVLEDDSERVLTWAELEQSSNRMARLLADQGIDETSLIVNTLPSTAEHFFLALGAWRLGACVLTLNPSMAPDEFVSVLETGLAWRPVFVVNESGLPLADNCKRLDLANYLDYDDSPVEEKIPNPGKAVASGGSTGRPKIIIDPKPWAHYPGAWGTMNAMGMEQDQVQLLAPRLHHNLGSNFAFTGLFENHIIVIPLSFDAAQSVRLIKKHQVNFMAALPIMMQRVLNLDDLDPQDLSSIKTIFHVGSACPEWVKRGWIDLIGAEKVWESYGTTESRGFTMIRGDDWLQHPGSCGRPFNSEFKILDEAQQEVEPGVVGEIYMRLVEQLEPTWPLAPTYEYIGAEPAKEDADGFVCVGDMGYFDKDGYMFIADRRVDMIISGGINIYPAEIEAVLSEHPEVEDVVVVGLVDKDWGHRVHAVVQARGDQLEIPTESLDKFCRERLSSYKAPKSYEFMEALPRDSSGKIRRAALRQPVEDA